MKNPFCLSDEKLKILLNAYSAWCESQEKEKDYPSKERNKSEELRNTLLSRGYLASAGDDEFTKKIFDYSRALEGPAFIRLGTPRITAKTADIKKNLLYLLDSADNPFEKAEKILSGEYKIPIFAKAFWTPLFQARYPQDLPNWNNKTENFFKALGVNLQTSKLSIKEKYQTVSDAFLYLQGLDPRQDFYTLNHLMHFGTAIEEGRNLIKELKQNGEDETAGGGTDQPIGDTSELCLIGTAGNIAAMGDAEAFLEKHGSWASWWSFPIKDEAIKLLKLPFYLYINARRGSFPFRFTVQEYRTSKGNEGIVSPWPEITEEKYKGLSKGGDKVSKVFKTWFKVTEIKRMTPPLSLEHFEPAEGLSKESSLLNQSTFGYAYCKARPPDHGRDPYVYSMEAALNELFIDDQTLRGIMRGLLYKKNIILQGPPGTGKTFLARRLAYAILGKKDEARARTIQFHQSYAYEDFIQGYRPTDGGAFELKNGIFYEFVKKAIRDPEGKYFLIIDEINRANLSKVFGELMMLIECDKRGPEFALPLTYSRPSDSTFFVPENVYLIGTMNTADRSITIVDYALRRRFLFFSLKPEVGEKFVIYLRGKNVSPNVIETLITRLTDLNEIIGQDKKHLGPGFEIGHSYFCPLEKVADSVAWYNSVIELEIKPLLFEYWFDDYDKADDLVRGLYL
jgi:MoxR-like ATPase